MEVPPAQGRHGPDMGRIRVQTMRVPAFELEVFFGKYEFSTPCLLAQSDCEAMSIDALLGLEPDAASARQDFLNTSLGYGENNGRPDLRRAVAGLYAGMAEENVVLFTGAQEGIFACMNTLLEPGDHVVCMFPAYQSLYEVARSMGCHVDFWHLRQTEQGWQGDMDELAALLRPDTKAIVLNTPNNPTGFTLNREQTDRLCELARQRGAWIFCDEVYRGLGWNAPSAGAKGASGSSQAGGNAPWIADAYERGISLGVLSKAYGLPGLRVGWLACRDTALMEGVARYKNYLSICGATPSEALALVALRHGEHLLAKNRGIISENLKTADAFFDRHARLFTYNRPQAGPIGFPRMRLDEPVSDFCERLAQEAGVLLLPGSVYGIKEPYFRIGYGRKTFAAHLARFEEWLVKKGLA